jgi:transposase-like protein
MKYRKGRQVRACALNAWVDQCGGVKRCAAAHGLSPSSLANWYHQYRQPRGQSLDQLVRVTGLSKAVILSPFLEG